MKNRNKDRLKRLFSDKKYLTIKPQRFIIRSCPEDKPQLVPKMIYGFRQGAKNSSLMTSNKQAHA